MKLIIFLALLVAGYKGWSQSDDCSTAIQINPSFTICNPQAGSSAGASQSMPSCSGGGNADDDVWYYFTANSSSMTIEVDPTVGYDAVIQLFDGNCGSPSLQCQDINGLNGDEVLSATGLTVGVNYYFRVYHYGVGSGTSTFNVCVSGLAAPNNNTACSAYVLPNVTPSCNFLSYTNAGSAGSSVATPTGCGGSSPFQGGYAGGDVWFEVVVPASGKLDIHTQAIDFNDGAMALYSGPCTSPTLVECDDDGDPGDGILMPHIYATGLTPGATMYIRVWEYGNNNNGEFGICVSTPDNDDCINAQQICDLNGYGGVTSSAYTIDQPSNMCGIGNPTNPNPSCVFGTGYTGPSPVQIDNNSWLQFTASSSIAELFVEIASCANGNGMQMQIFEGTNCSNFTPVSNFLETTTSQTVVATGLTPGNTYYIVVDGFAGDICSYTISATSGVQVVEAVAMDDQLCLGESTSITAQVTGTGSYTYSWSSDPLGTYPTTGTINVTPSVTTEYTVDITGVCGSITSASVLITVNNPPVANAGNDQTICDGQTANLMASGGLIYQWSGLGNGANQTVSPNSTSTYTVTATDANGCTDTDNITVNVNPSPIANAGIDTALCEGGSITLIASGGGIYDWGNGFSGNPNHTISPNSNASYSVSVQNSFGCIDTDNVDVTVYPLPNAFAGNDISVCNGGTTTLSASGGIHYDWDDPSLMDVANQTIGPLNNTVSYQVSVTDINGCTDTDDITINVGSALIPDAGSDTTICQNASLTYVATGGINYTWEDASGTTVSNNPNYSPSTSTLGNAWYYVTVDDGGSCMGVDSVQVSVVGHPVANAGNDTSICLGDTAIISGTGGIQYQWNNSLGSGQNQTVSPNTNTTYILTVVDANGCLDSDDVLISVNALPTVMASNDETICLGESVSISASGAVSYIWNQSLGAGSAQTVSPTSTSHYLVIGTDGNNCSNTDSVNVFVNDLPTIDTSSIQIESADCINGGGTISGIVVIGNPGFSYEWTDANGGSILDTTLSIGGLNPGNYSLMVTDANNCSEHIMVNIGFLDLSSLYALNDSINTPPSTLTNVFVYGNDTGDVSSISIVTPPNHGSASVGSGGYIEYTSNSGFFGVDSLEYEICDLVCTSACERAWVIITVDEQLPIDLPNGFSPNGDGYNDNFVIDNIEQYPENEILIFNRWGDQVYTAAPYVNDWDGSTSNAQLKLRGNKVVDGTYFVVLKLGEGFEPLNGYIELRTK